MPLLLFGDLVFQHFHILTPDAVVIVILHGDVHAVPAARAAPVVEEGKLERKAAVKVVEAGAPPVKDGRLIFGLCELVVDVLVFNGFGVIAVRYPAHPVPVHFPVREGLLGGGGNVLSFREQPRRPCFSGFLPAGFPALLLFRNRLRLLSGAKQRIEVFGFVRPHTGIEEPGADDVFQHFFQRQTVSFIHSQKEEREHEADHQEHGGTVPDTATGKQVSREAHRRRAGKTNKLAPR